MTFFLLNESDAPNIVKIVQFYVQNVGFVTS